MKNLLFLGAVALLLFSLSAALSLWLNQSNLIKKEPDQHAAESKDSGKALTKNPPPGDTQKDKEKDPSEKKATTIPPAPLPGINSPDVGTLDQQAKLERKAAQITMVLADLQSQREATDALLKQVTAAVKDAAKAPAPEMSEERLKEEREKARKIEEANIRKLAAIYDAMSPEGAAPNIKSMAESGPGKLEQVAQIIMLMKERNAAKLMEALNEPSLVAQLMDKMRQLKAQGAAIAPAPAPAPAPAFGSTGITPARGP